MVIVNGTNPAYYRVGELNFKDEDSTCIIVLCYVPNQSIKGQDNFVLISNDTSDDIRTDINYPSRACYDMQGSFFSERLNKQPYHYSDARKRISPKSDSITNERNSSVSYSEMTMLPFKKRIVRH